MDTTEHVKDMFKHTEELFFIFGKNSNGEPIIEPFIARMYKNESLSDLPEKVELEICNITTDLNIDKRSDYVIYHADTELPVAVAAALTEAHRYLPKKRTTVHTLEQFLNIVADVKIEDDLVMTNWQARCVFNAMFESHKEITTDVMVEYVELFQEDSNTFEMPADLDECFERFKVPGETCQTYAEREGKSWEVTEQVFHYFHELMMPMALGWVKEHTRYAYIMSECLTDNLYDKFVETKEDGPSRYYYECVDITKDDDFKVLDPEYFYDECEECGNRFPDDQMTRTQDTDGYVCDGCINDEEE